MAGRKKNGRSNGDEDTETTMTDILREISGKLDRLDPIETRLEEIAHDVKELKTVSVTRHRQLDARVSRLETQVAKMQRRRS